MNPFAKALSEALSYAIVSRQVSEDGEAVGFLYREAAVFDNDSGWRIFSGAEDDEYMDNTEHFDTVALNKIVADNPEIAHLISQSEGAWAWDEAEQGFVAVEDWSPQD